MSHLVTHCPVEYFCSDMELLRPGSSGEHSRERLDSWKEIAEYLRRDVRTAMRWERSRGMPVHRIPGGGRSGVYAIRSEVDEWREGQRGDQLPPPLHPAVAVLPFVNLAADKDNEHFGDGLADEIITELTRFSGLRVTARTSSFAFRGQQRDAREIGKRLNVSALLEGSVQRAGNRVRVSAQLVDAMNGFHLWSEHYDFDFSDVFAIQDAIAAAIASALECRLLPPRPVRSAPHPEAYGEWLQGRYHQHCESLEALAKSRRHLEAAIASDPRFPQPYIALAELCRASASFGLMQPREALREATEALHRAFEIDPLSGEAHALSGTYEGWMRFDWREARNHFDRALRLAPGSELAHRLYALYYLAPAGRLDEAEAEMALAVQSDPLSAVAHIQLGKVLLWARKFDRAQAEIDSALDLRPDHALALWYWGVAEFLRGEFEAAVEIWRFAMSKLGWNPAMSGAIGMALGYLGRHAEARALLTELETASRERYTSSVSLAQIHLGLGEKDAAFERLNCAIDERDPHILGLPRKPIWDGLRDDPRFKELLRRMDLP